METTNTKKQRVFSGIQPSGMPHIGNYFGALKNWVQLQDEYEGFYCVVNYHAITVVQDKNQFPIATWNMARDLLACGIDPEKSILFIQSDVPYHVEFAWILGSATMMGELERMTQFKDKSQQHRDNINADLFTYPILQASDIALYKAHNVPIGEDQIQHLELTREIVRRFNFRHQTQLIEPAAIISESARIMGLDGKQKMSKSLDNYIGIFEDEESIQKKVMRAVTDENRKRKTDPGNPDICNVFTMHKSVTSQDSRDQLSNQCRNAEIGCVDCKKEFLKNLFTELKPLREKQVMLSQKPEIVDQALEQGKERALPIAKQTIDEIKESMGIGYHHG